MINFVIVNRTFFNLDMVLRNVKSRDPFSHKFIRKVCSGNLSFYGVKKNWLDSFDFFIH